MMCLVSFRPYDNETCSEKEYSFNRIVNLATLAKKKKTQKDKNETLAVYSETVPKEIANSRKILYLMSQPRCGGQSLLRSLFDLPESEFHYYIFFQKFIIDISWKFLTKFCAVASKISFICY